MKTICEHTYCTGCGLCASLCPVSSITMKPGKMGHLFPKINNKKCIDCGLCEKSCPALNPVELIAAQHAYAAWSKDDADYRSSTSGGASSVLSQYIINKGGVVYGCSVLCGAKIEHIRIEKKEDLHKIKGSKYVQSSIVKVLTQIKKDVKEKRIVLFLGTPCQIAAVQKLFKNTPDNLFLVDLVCHGTPSQRSLHDYLKRYVPLDEIEDVRFRSEEGYSIKVFSKNKNVYTSSELWSCRNKDYYYNSFMDGYSLRDSCHKCKYSSPNRCSDMTIGDFWGLGKEMPCEDIPEHKFGISLVLPITAKGRTLFNEISNAMNVFKRPISEAINGNDQLQHPKEISMKARIYRFFQPIIGDKGSYDVVLFFIKLKSLTKKLF